ncbi:uncharacterized protein EI97DRAFT_430442 [Westerdykella ornata]|uniref:Uncharacterized protein n=1 Tax=Westerdykella ornata TaxID=318751 RepID=A0A6A6JS24_WESOR|nr:uncharacterized protein EI97DRAFT_430442 [Westerdykella ornata]KAF2279362.1 hypothetical protein EI97DRAFT_430442 [Westerdykella ornata]
MNPHSSIRRPRVVTRPSPPTLYFFEVWEDKLGNLCARDGQLPYDRVEDWLKLEGTYKTDANDSIDLAQSMILRLIACDFDQHPFAIGCGLPTFNQIQEAFHLNENSVEAIINNNGAFGRFYERSPGSSATDLFSLVFKVGNSINIGYDAMSMTYNMKRRTTRAFLHGFLDHDSQSLIEYLKTCKDKLRFESPFLLPCRIYRKHRAKSEAYRVSIDDNLQRAEVEIGYAIPGVLDGTADPISLLRSGNIEFERINRRLTSCSTELCTVLHTGAFGKELGIFLRNTAQELGSKLYSPDNDGLSHNQTLVQEIEFTTNLYSSLLSQASNLRTRVENHIQLGHSLVAQEENRISRFVAEESARIAAATKGDSAAMKAISLVTMIFLPPTFVATFFSMSMFNWEPQGQDPGLVSKYLWIYWAVTIPLTVIVVVCWRLWMIKENRGFNTLPKRQEDEKSDRVSVADANHITPTAILMAEYSEAQKQQVRPYWRRRA